MAGLVPATHRATDSDIDGARAGATGSFAYLLASKPYGTLYIGVTNDLCRHVGEHCDGAASTLTRRYRVNRLVRYEHWYNIDGAIQRETSLKKWPRDWSINLLERSNLRWDDLYPWLIG